MKNIKRLLNILFLLSFAVIITGCNKPGGNGGETSKELTDEELVQSVIDGVVIPETINKGLELPSEDPTSVVINTEKRGTGSLSIVATAFHEPGTYMITGGRGKKEQ